MAAPTRKPINPFNSSEVMTDEAAEAEELSQEGAAEQPQQPTPDSRSGPPAGQEAAQEPQADASTESQPPQGEEDRPQARDRWQKLLDDRKEARQQAADLQRQLNESNERWARLDERRKQLDEARRAADTQAQQARIAAERPDPAIDPVGANQWDAARRIEALEAQLQQVTQNFGQMQQGYQVDREEQEFNNWTNYSAQEYMRTQPDYLDAAKYAAEKRMGFWQDLGLQSDQARQIVINESKLLARISRESGRPFAPLIYKLAGEWGYQRGNGNGGVQPTAQAASQAGKVLSQVARGQSLQGLGRVSADGSAGRSRYRDMTAADIANLSEREWSAAMANPTTKQELQYAMRRADGLDNDEVEYMSRR